MPFPDFFEQFRIYSIYGFLPPEICGQLCSEIESAATVTGEVWNPETGKDVNEEIKKRKEAIGIPASSEEAIREKKLLALMPAIEKHFSVKLTGVQPIKFTRYDEGDYYRMHRDISTGVDLPSIISDRKISVIIFVNQEGENREEGDYCGGNLTFYGLLDNPGWHSVGLPLESEAGLLIAFAPDVPHEVTTVTEGTRFSITTWFV